MLVTAINPGLRREIAGTEQLQVVYCGPIMVEAGSQAAHTERRHVDLDGVSRTAGRAGFQRHATHSCRFHVLRDPPGEFKQTCEVVQGQRRPAEFALSPAGKKYRLQRSHRVHRSRRQTNAACAGVVFEEGRLRGLRKSLPFQPHQLPIIFNVGHVFGGGMEKTRLDAPRSPKLHGAVA
jgi:hypothetical protein